MNIVPLGATRVILKCSFQHFTQQIFNDACVVFDVDGRLTVMSLISGCLGLVSLPLCHANAVPRPQSAIPLSYYTCHTALLPRYTPAILHLPYYIPAILPMPYYTCHTTPATLHPRLSRSDTVPPGITILVTKFASQSHHGTIGY